MGMLSFLGKINDGIGKHGDLGIPGREELQDPHTDWPSKLHPGSLNVAIDLAWLPAKVDRKKPARDVHRLLVPAVTISGSDLKNNKLNEPADAWRAVMYKPSSKVLFDCWVFRRRDSGIGVQLEVVSDKPLRASYNLSTGDEVIVMVFG